MIRFLIVGLVIFIVGSTSTTAEGQTYEVSAGWTLPIGNLSDLTQGGPSVRFSYSRPVSWFSKGTFIAWAGYTDHRGKTYELPEDVEGFGGASNKISGQDIPVMAGVRFKKEKSKGHVDLTGGLLWKRIKLNLGGSLAGTSTGTGTDTDPAIAAHGSYTIYGGPETSGGGGEN